MSEDMGYHNAKETTDGWIRRCSCGGEAWPQTQDDVARLGSLIAVECFRCPNSGPSADSTEEAIREWNAGAWENGRRG